MRKLGKSLATILTSASLITGCSDMKEEINDMCSRVGQLNERGNMDFIIYEVTPGAYKEIEQKGIYFNSFPEIDANKDEIITEEEVRDYLLVR